VAAAAAPPPAQRRPSKAARTIAAIIPAAKTGARISVPAAIRAQLIPANPGIQAQRTEALAVAFLLALQEYVFPFFCSFPSNVGSSHFVAFTQTPFPVQLSGHCGGFTTGGGSQRNKELLGQLKSGTQDPRE